MQPTKTCGDQWRSLRNTDEKRKNKQQLKTLQVSKS